MRRDGNALHRLRTLGALQSLKEQASRADLVEARAAHEVARNNLARHELALTEKADEVDTLMAQGVLDFDRWRIGLAVIGELATAQEMAANLTRASADEESLRQIEWHREEAVQRHLRLAGRKLARRLSEKADEAMTAEAVGLTSARTIGWQA